MSLALPLFLQLAASAAPSVAPQTLAAFAQAESRLEPLAIGDNDTGLSYRPDTVPEAVALASSLLAQRHSLDLGIMQVNSANLARIGLTVEAAFDPAQSIRAGAAILTEAYLRCRRNGEVAEQPALQRAASIYNTGREQAGILNGYQARVWRVAAQLVPAIQVATETGTGSAIATPRSGSSQPATNATATPMAPRSASAGAAAPSGPVPVQVLSAPARPPAWDVYASAVKGGAKQ